MRFRGTISLSSSLRNTASKIRAFRKLPAGWHYGRGTAPTQETIDAALSINANAIIGGLTDTDAIVGFNGEIQVMIYHGTSHLEFTIEPSGLIDYSREDARREVETADALSPDDALTRLRDFQRKVWLSSGSFTAHITSSGSAGSANLPSKSTETMREFPSLSWTAPPQQVARFVDT